MNPARIFPVSTVFAKDAGQDTPATINIIFDLRRMEYYEWSDMIVPSISGAQSAAPRKPIAFKGFYAKTGLPHDDAAKVGARWCLRLQ